MKGAPSRHINGFKQATTSERNVSAPHLYIVWRPTETTGDGSESWWSMSVSLLRKSFGQQWLAAIGYRRYFCKGLTPAKHFSDDKSNHQIMGIGVSVFLTLLLIAFTFCLLCIAAIVFCVCRRGPQDYTPSQVRADSHDVDRHRRASTASSNDAESFNEKFSRNTLLSPFSPIGSED